MPVSEPKDESGGGGTGGEGIKSWAAALAARLNISIEQATNLIQDYVAKNGGSYQHAATAINNAGPDVNDGNGSGSGGTGSGGSSSGGSSGSAAPTAQQLANAAASYRAILTAWGLPQTSALKKLIDQAVKGGVSSQAFVEKLRTTKDYAKRFAGIMKPNGTLRMTEAQYISGYQQAKDYAGSIGRNFSPELYALAIKNGQSPSEIRFGLDTLDKLKAYGPQLAEFNDYLLTTGKIKKPLKGEDLRDFVMGRRKDLQQEWDVANTAFMLQDVADVNVDKPNQGGDVSYRELTGLIKHFQATGGDLKGVDFAQMGSLIANVVPKNELYGAGIRKRDIVEMMLNGKNAADITKRVQNVLDTYEAAVTEPGAQSQNQQGKTYQNTPQKSSE